MPDTQALRAPASMSPPAPLCDPRTIRVEVLPSPTALLSHLPGWTALAESAAEANVFYEPCVLGPALRTFGHRHDLSIVVVLADPAAPLANDGPPVLLGLFPLERRPPAGDLPLPHLSLWMHDYLYVPVPLVHRDFGREVMTALFDWLTTQRLAAPILAVDKLPVGGPFHQLLVEELARRGSAPGGPPTQLHVRDRYVRAVMAPTTDGESYQARALAGKHRKELRRRRKRLSELGDLRFQALDGEADLQAFIDSFLTLESSGWKGEEGSALASRARDARFFSEMIRACHHAGRLEATSLEVDGRPLAMQTLLRSGGSFYAFKMAYDESHARFSPGVLLVLDLVERVAASPEPCLVDSVADRNHPMVNQLFTERRNVESLVVAVGSGPSLLLALLPAFRWAKRALRRSGAGRKPSQSGDNDASSPSLALVQAG